MLDSDLTHRLLAHLFADPADAVSVLAQLPVARVVPGRSKGVFRPAVPASLQLGEWLLTPHAGQTVARHTVGGVVLSTEALGPAAAARLVVRLLHGMLADVPASVSDVCVAHLGATAEVRGIA